MRLWGLNATSLWYDETFMLYHAQRGVVEGVSGLLREDNALPLYGLFLAVWVQVAGSGEFAARYLSALLGTVAMSLVLRLGGAVQGRRYAGWGAALAFATLPIHVYYAQEVRMYALVVPLATAFAWMAWRLVEKGRGLVTYVILGAAMLFTHLYAGLLWAAILVWGTITFYVLRVRNRNSLRVFRARWWRANLFLGMVAIPIAAWALWRARVDATAVSAIPTIALRWIPVLFGVGQYLPEPWTTLFVVVAVLSLAIAMVGLIRNRRSTGAIWIVSTLIVPVALLLAATFAKAKWGERYLLPSLGLALVVGVGSGWESGLQVTGYKLQAKDSESWFSRFTFYVSLIVGSLLFAAWLALALPALARQAEGTWAVGLTDEWHPRPDFRGVAQYIEANDTPEDAIVVIGGYAAHTLDYYYDGPAPLFGLPFDSRLLDTRAALDLHALTTLQEQTASAERLWVVLWQDTLADPTGLVRSVLVDACHRLPVSDHFTNIGVMRFDVTMCQPLDRLAEPPFMLNAEFVEPIRLVGYDLIRTDVTWEVDLWWETSGALAEDYHVFVHLVDEDGTQVAQHDHIAGADAYPASLWLPGAFLRDRFFLNVPGETCENCALRVGLYTEQGRLLLRDGTDHVAITLELD